MKHPWLACIFGFLYLVLSWKQGQKFGKLSDINQVLDILGQLLQKFLFGFLEVFVRHSSLISYMSDLYILIWLSGLIAVDCGPEFYFYMCGLALSVCIYSLSVDIPEIFSVTSKNDNKIFSDSWSSHGVDLTSQWFASKTGKKQRTSCTNTYVIQIFCI